ncbi:hypothetical protein E1B28_002530 [Marasmius oreades]|uniref:Uncharacterized protein n=1 Tax=Marasmius oreades TaxID=181124 RepID=A0A9P7UP17_9AGAR|nr:uncharacterized protein E1B28_002530 [Marasmius oreades]KAG7086584.1 hypothetical protein E1B28_002530 [Marasmius oreades]
MSFKFNFDVDEIDDDLPEICTMSHEENRETNDGKSSQKQLKEISIQYLFSWTHYRLKFLARPFKYLSHLAKYVLSREEISLTRGSS